MLLSGLSQIDASTDWGIVLWADLMMYYTGLLKGKFNDFKSGYAALIQCALLLKYNSYLELKLVLKTK